MNIDLSVILNSAALLAAVGACIRTEQRITRLETLVETLMKKGA